MPIGDLSEVKARNYTVIGNNDNNGLGPMREPVMTITEQIKPEKLEETKDEFYADKITLSKFYMEQLLPLASGYTSSVKAGKDTLYSIKSENF